MPEQTNKEIPQEVIQGMMDEYDRQRDDRMGKLHNQFVIFISEAKLPIPDVLMVLEMIKQESLDLAKQKYLGA